MHPLTQGFHRRLWPAPGMRAGIAILTALLLLSGPVQAQDNSAVATATAIAQARASVPDEAPPDATYDLEDDYAEAVTAQNTVSLPFTWQGPATVSARALGASAQPLEAIVNRGEFRVAYVPAEDGALLRILPDMEAESTGELQIVWRLDDGDAAIAFASGAVVALRLSARVYAPDATTQIFIADDAGSSSVALDGLNWREFAVARALDVGSTEVRLGLRWADVPANAWLELRDVTVTFGDTEIALSPVDSAAVTLVEVPTALPTPEALPTLTPTPVPATPPVSAAVEAVQAPTATPLATPTPEFIIVTSTPTPVDVFEEATRVAQATDWARIVGPVTPTPENMVTATPTSTPIVLLYTPTPENAATATHAALLATAIAFTTGTPTPFPPDAVVVMGTATLAPARATNTPRPTNTPTPLFVLLNNIPTPAPAATVAFPAELLGKIVFLTDYRGNRNNPDALVINPDGSNAGVMTSRLFYNRALHRDRFSPDMRYHVYSRQEGAAGNSGVTQIFYDDAFYQSTGHQVTYFGEGVAWASTWSPVGETIALVSSVTGNDEIWTVRRGDWQPAQLTHNDWEWDHHPSFSPDGSQIVFYSNRVTGRRQLWIMDADGSNQRQLTNFPFEAWNPVWVKYLDLPE